MDEERQNQAEEQQPPRQSKLASATMNLGLASLVALVLVPGPPLLAPFLLCLVPILPILGLIVGVISMVQIRRNPSTLTGRNTAVGGMLICAIPILLALAWVFPWFLRDRGPNQRTNCLNNLKQIGTAVNMYQTDWDDKYPLVSGPGRAFEEAMGQTWNYRTNSTGGERRWMQNLLAPYVKSKKVYWCLALEEDATWKTGGKHPGVVHYWQNRHGGLTWNAETCPDPHSAGNPRGLEVLGAPKGSTVAGLPFESDPPTTYWFNAAITDHSGKNRGSKVISGQRKTICAREADAPIAWDTPCGYAARDGQEAQIAHEEAMNILYADGHAKPYAIHNSKSAEWTNDHFGNTHGYEGWFPE